MSIPTTDLDKAVFQLFCKQMDYMPYEQTLYGISDQERAGHLQEGWETSYRGILIKAEGSGYRVILQDTGMSQAVETPWEAMRIASCWVIRGKPWPII
jgi:hypothetical protein